MIDNESNIQSYEDEIDLRELILALWRQKAIIISMTLVFTIVAGIFAMFIKAPVYETNLNIVISIPETYVTRYGEYKLPISSNGDYFKLIKSNDVIVNTLNDMGYDTKEITIENLKERITLGDITTTAGVIQNSFNVTVSADNSEESLQLAEHLYENYIDFMDVMMKERAISYYYNDFTVQIKTLENTLAKTQEILTENEKLLADTPQTINQKEATKELQTGVSDYIILENIINPNYTTLEGKIIENKQLLIETQSSIDQYGKYLEELDVEKAALDKYYASGKAGKMESSIMDLVDVSIYQPSVPVAPTRSSGMGTVMYLAIGGVLGGMLSVMFVLFRAYWRKEI
ncbi:MAG: capA [Anaerocolumna sp.]|jgi:capsular polysaccharide biosynthesis protein|nr:capA [Anaerocolumna sp.]